MVGRVIAEKNGAVGRIVIDQVDKHNAISLDMWEALSTIVAQFAADDVLRAVVVCGAGDRAFSAGADISQFAEKRASASQVEQYNRFVDQTNYDLANLAKPTIAMIQGYCIGGGLGLALCCDLRIAADDGRFGIPAAKLGLTYGWDEVRPLAALVGPGYAKEILYTGRQFSAAEAYDMGLINRLVVKAELAAYVETYAQTIAANAPLTLRAVKRTIAEVGRDVDQRDYEAVQKAIDDCYASEDYIEGRKAFMEKRKPQFRGR